MAQGTSRAKHKSKKEKKVKRIAVDDGWKIVERKKKKGRKPSGNRTKEIIAMRDGRVLHSRSMTCPNTTTTILKTLQHYGFSTSLTEITDGVRCMTLTDTPAEENKQQQSTDNTNMEVPDTPLTNTNREAFTAPCIPVPEQILQDVDAGIHSPPYHSRSLSHT